MRNERENQVYIRLLELIALVTEDWGKVTEKTNNYLFKGSQIKDAGEALYELQKIKSPLNELEGLITTEITRMANNESQKT